MNYWFECKVCYNKLDDSGKNKKMSDIYLVDALSFTEAEKRVNEEVSPFSSAYENGLFTIEGIKHVKIGEIFGEDIECEKWFKCKVNFITVDEVSAKEKKISSVMLVHADDMQEAFKNLKEGLKDSISDSDIVSMTETAIADIFHYNAPA